MFVLEVVIHMKEKSLSLRIIGGKWRSRKVSFVALRGVRPTTNLVRETLFNWLGSAIVHATCLDLFAGSGALGFEALSRGALRVIMVDASKNIVKTLQKNARTLQATDVEFYCTQIPEHLLQIPPQPFDIIFLDPPFCSGLIKPTCEKLLNYNYLATGALVYVEAEKQLDIAMVIPQSWQILRKKTSGMVGCYLLRSHTSCVVCF